MRPRSPPPPLTHCAGVYTAVTAGNSDSDGEVGRVAGNISHNARGTADSKSFVYSRSFSAVAYTSTQQFGTFYNYYDCVADVLGTVRHRFKTDEDAIPFEPPPIISDSGGQKTVWSDSNGRRVCCYSRIGWLPVDSSGKSTAYAHISGCMSRARYFQTPSDVSAKPNMPHDVDQERVESSETALCDTYSKDGPPQANDYVHVDKTKLVAHSTYVSSDGRHAY